MKPIGMVRVALFAAFLPQVVEAQVATGLQDGVRVRVVRNNGRAIVGLVSAGPPDSLSIIAEKSGAATRSFSLSDISHVEVSRGISRSKGALLKGLIGLGAGAAAGGIIGAATYEKSECDVGTGQLCIFDCLIICTRSQSAVFGGMLLGAVGLAAGTVVGLVTGWEQWQAVPARIR